MILEKVAIASYDHTKKILSDIDGFKAEIEKLDVKSENYNKYIDMYNNRIQDYLELAKQSTDVYGQKEEKYLDGVKALREKIENEYKELVTQYYS